MLFFCSNASIDSRKITIGDPIEVALVEFADEQQFQIQNIRDTYPRLKEIPFDATTKMMGTLHKMPNGKYLVCIKGALEVVLKESDFTCNHLGENQLEVNNHFWVKQANLLAAKGLRVLAFAYSIIDDPLDDFFHHLNFLGCTAFLDPPRKEIFDAIQECKKAGVKVVMVTGDHPETAKTIAQKVGLNQNHQTIVKHANEIKELPVDQVDVLKTVDVFARVTPAQKLQLIERYQQLGFITAMTGDGINDAPALKKADIGIAMGIRGTEAAKESADLILEDDLFSSIVLAIRQGRGIFENIRYFVIYLLSCNLSELLVVTGMSVTNIAIPLLPLQILFLNMVTDVFPALALGMNRESKAVMERPPRDPKVPIISTKIWKAISGYAFAISLGVLCLTWYSHYYLSLDKMTINNMVFYTLTLAQLWHVFNLPGAKRSFWNNEVVRNPFIWGAILLCIFIVVFAYWVAPVNQMLGLTSVSFDLIFVAFVFSWIPVLLIQGWRLGSTLFCKLV